MIDDAEGSVAVAGVLGPLRLEDVLFAAAKANRVGPLQVVRADMVVGVDHLQCAARMAHRAKAEGTQHADRLEVDFLRYAAAERQIKRALAKMGLPDGAPAAAVVALGPKRLDALRYFVDYLGLREDDRVLESSDEKVAAFGIEAAALAVTPARLHADLVLEAVASVALMR